MAAGEGRQTPSEQKVSAVGSNRRQTPVRRSTETGG